MAEDGQQHRKHLMPPIRLKQVDAPEQDPYLVYLPLSTPLNVVEECIRAHVLRWSVWKSCEHSITFLDKHKYHLSDKNKSFRDYLVQLTDDVFFLAARKPIILGPEVESPAIAASAGEKFLIDVVCLGLPAKISMAVRPRYELAWIRAQIKGLLHIPYDEQCLIWKGKEYSQHEDTTLLEDLGLKYQSELWLLHKRQVAHRPCVCWHLNEFLHRREDKPHRSVSAEILNDPTVSQVYGSTQLLKQRPPPAYGKTSK